MGDALSTIKPMPPGLRRILPSGSPPISPHERPEHAGRATTLLLRRLIVSVSQLEIALTH